jgi:hypothetical protein
MPDVECTGARLYELMREGGFWLVDTTGSGAVANAVASGSHAVQVARYAGPAMPGLPAAILVRPDGYVAWASNARSDLPTHAASAVTQWCGPSSSAHPALPRP